MAEFTAPFLCRQWTGGKDKEFASQLRLPFLCKVRVSRESAVFYVGWVDSGFKFLAMSQNSAERFREGEGVCFFAMRVVRLFISLES